MTLEKIDIPLKECPFCGGRDDMPECGIAIIWADKCPHLFRLTYPRLLDGTLDNSRCYMT